METQVHNTVQERPPAYPIVRPKVQQSVLASFRKAHESNRSAPPPSFEGNDNSDTDSNDEDSDDDLGDNGVDLGLE